MIGIRSKHPALVNEFSYDSSLLISEYLRSLEMKIASVIQRAPDAFSVWASYYKDYEFNDWNWYAWQNLPDAALADWRSTVLDQFGPVPQDVLQKISLKLGQILLI